MTNTRAARTNASAISRLLTRAGYRGPVKARATRALDLDPGIVCVNVIEVPGWVAVQDVASVIENAGYRVERRPMPAVSGYSVTALIVRR